MVTWRKNPLNCSVNSSLLNGQISKVHSTYNLYKKDDVRLLRIVTGIIDCITKSGLTDTIRLQELQYYIIHTHMYIAIILYYATKWQLPIISIVLINYYCN